MQRRSFVRSLALASLGAFPSAGCMLVPTGRDAILQSFCGEQFFALDKPFNVGALTYATNNRQIVRCARLQPLADDFIERPPVEALYLRLWHPTVELRPRALPAMAELVPYGWGCPKCLDTLNDHSCNWHWDAIKRKRRESFPSLVEVDGCFFEYAVMLKVHAIRGVRYSAKRVSPTDSFLFFAGDGFQGISTGVNIDV